MTPTTLLRGTSALPDDYLADHQLRALRKLANGKILWGGVGTGKSRVAVAYYKQNEAPKHVYVITTAKKRDSFDWQKEFYSVFVGPVSGPVHIPAKVGRRRKAGASSDVRRDHVAVQRGVDLAVLREDSGGVARPDQRDGNDLEAAEGPGTRGRSERASEHQLGALGRGAGSLSTGMGARRAGGVSDDSSTMAGGRSIVVRSIRDAEIPRFPRGRGDVSGREDTNRVSDNSLGATEQSSVDGSGTGGSNAGSRSVEGKDGLGVGVGSTPGYLGEPGVYPWVLTVDSWNNVNKYADVVGAFFIFDEQRLVGSGLWSKAFLRIARRNNWILLSATPGDTWMDYVPVFVANGFYKNRSEFKREHVVYNTFTKFPKVDRFINVGRLVRQRASLLVEMPYVRHTKRRHVEVPLAYDKDALDLVLTKRWHVFEDRPLRDVGEMFSVARRVVNGDPSRLEMVKELWTIHPKLIVFYNFDYELEMLRSLATDISSEEMLSPDHIGSRKKSSSSLRQTMFPASEPSKMLSGCGSNEGVLVWAAVDRGAKTISPRTSLCSGSHAGLAGEYTKGQNEWNSPNPSEKPPFGTTTCCTEEKPDKKSSNTSTTSSGIGTCQHGHRSCSEVARPTGNRPESGMDCQESTPRQSFSMSVAEWNGHLHQPIPTTDRWLYLVQYIAGAEAWECIDTDATIFFSRNYSWKIWEQAQGRMDRLNTPFKDLWYYNFTTDSWIDRAIERSLRAKKTFNEADYGRKFKE